MSAEISRAEVFRMIRGLVTGKGTATLYIHTDNNRMIIVAAQDGEIITLTSGPKHGAKAIPMLQEMQSAKVRVDDNAISLRSENMPPTSELLTLIETETPDASDESGKRSPATRVLTPKVEEAKGILSQLLTEYMGPIAPMYCEQVLDSLGNSLDGDNLLIAVDKMAKEAGGPAEAQAFTEQALKKLRKVAG